MSDVLNTDEGLSNNRVNLELGHHETNGEKQEKNQMAAVAGSLNPAFWSEAVAERVGNKGYSLLTVDGMKPYTENLFELWCKLPDRPSRLNTEGVVDIVAGDMQAPYEIFGLSLAYVEASKALGQSNRLERLKSEGVNIAPGLGMIGTGGFLLSRLFRRGQEKNTMSRRNFLKGGIAAAGLLVGGAALSAPRLVLRNLMDTPNAETHDMLLEISSKWDLVLDTNEFIEGRTAVLIAKAKEAAALNGTEPPKAAVVMGSAHMTKAREIDENNEIRAEMIRNLYDEIIKIFSPIVVDTGKATPQELEDALKDYLASYDIWTVSDPAPGQPTSGEFAQKPHHWIKRKASYKCKEIEDALNEIPSTSKVP